MKPLKRVLNLDKSVNEKNFENNFGGNKINEETKEDSLTNDNQAQTLSLDLLSQTLQFDFHSNNVNNSANFL